MVKQTCKQIPGVIFILFLTSYSLNADTSIDSGGSVRYYQANDIGMKIKEIREQDVFSFEYVLTIEKTDELEERKLYSNNAVMKRWELSFYNNNTIREEREFDANFLTNLKYYDRRSRLIEEHLYSDNRFIQKTIYSYREDYRLDQTKTFNNKGSLIYSETYEFNRIGMLRRVKRLWTDGREHISSFIYGKGRLIEEIFSTKEDMTISRFDSTGRLASTEFWKKDLFVRKTVFGYNKEDSIISSFEQDFQTGAETEKKYNKEGRIEKEIITKNEVTVSEDTYYYDEKGRKSKMDRVSDRGLEEWEFSYNAEGELDQEEYYQRGVLEKRTIYTSDNSYYEELFRYGELLIRIYYEDEAKVKEEFIDNGEVIRINNLLTEES